MHVGVGSTLAEAEQPVFFKEENIAVLSFGWDVIKCPVASIKKGCVNPYKKTHVLKIVSERLRHTNNLVCFFHWGYELEAFPLPYDRELSHTLIDMGVRAVIGCHAHRVQQVEFYKGRPIVYGLGNFLFPHRYYWNGRLRFPDFTKKELAFELAPDGKFITHKFEYDITGKRLQYLRSEEVDAGLDDFDLKAEYSDYSGKEYDNYFKKHRFHKTLIPVFYSSDNNISYIAKSSFVKIRGKIIDMLVRMNIKSKK